METGQLDNVIEQPCINHTKKKKMLSFLLVLVLSTLLGTLIFMYTLLNRSSIYKGVVFNNMDIGGLSPQEFFVSLEDYYSNVYKNNILIISGNNFEKRILISELGIKLDIEAMVQKAYNTGREGNLIERLSCVFSLKTKPVFIELITDYETDLFNNFLDHICKEVYQEITPTNIIIGENSVTLQTGIPGQEVDVEKLKEDIIKAINGTGVYNIDLHLNKRLPAPIDIETTLKTINQEPIDAKFIKSSRTTYEIIPHQTGRKIDYANLLEIINYVDNRKSYEYEEILLPVEFITPNLTEDKLKDQLFKDTLASYTTYFKTDTENNINRSINIALASASIDGTILMPDEEFSFNEIVGQRTAEKGYKIAHIFVDGQIKDGTGGGICQVSTTLYNAVLRSNLTVSERHNHMFTVGYVPLGTDAAVSYGYADLIFKNTTKHPLIIDVKSSGTQLTVNIRAMNDYPDLKVKIATKTIKKIPVIEQVINDPSLPQGSYIIKDKGMDGYEVETYIKVFNGDTLLREEKLHTSIYQMLPRKIIQGSAPIIKMSE